MVWIYYHATFSQGCGKPMITRRSLLKSTAVSTVFGLGGLASTSPVAATGASFGDGVNLQPTYFCDGDQDLGWDLMNDHSDISTVRIEIEPPSWGETSATLSDARRWIDEANANGYQVIATCHHYPNNGSGDPQALYDAASWWADNYSYLSANSSFVVNLHNEWGSHDTTASEYANAYNNALNTVRNNTSYTGPIVCDLSGYGQETDIAADASSSITDDNIIFSAHIYPSAYNSVDGDWLDVQDLDYLDDNSEYPCMIGEFGSKRDGQADWSALVDHAKSLGWPVLGWAWNGDGSSEPMNMTSPYWGDQCSATSPSKTAYFETIYSKLGSEEDDSGNTEKKHLNAEYHSHDGVSTSTSRSGYWGDAYVTGFDSTGDSVTMDFDAAASGDRTVMVRYASEHDTKEANLYVNENSKGKITLPQSSSFTKTGVGTYAFNEGTNTITIEKGWGYYDIDAVVVE